MTSFGLRDPPPPPKITYKQELINYFIFPAEELNIRNTTAPPIGKFNIAPFYCRIVDS